VPFTRDLHPSESVAPRPNRCVANRPGTAPNWLWVLILLHGLLSACGIQQRSPPAPSLGQEESAKWRQHYSRMLALTQWHVQGKIGYHGNQEAGSAWLDWQQQGDRFHLLLSGPFGAGTVAISGDSHEVTLRQPGHPDHIAASPAQLSIDVLGWELPIEELTYWIRGIPAPGASAQSRIFTEEVLLSSFQQAGWQLQLDKYRDTSAGRLPGKLRATRGATRVTVVIKEHTFDTALANTTTAAPR